MGSFTVALFGEAEKGEYKTPYLCQTLSQLESYLGQPPLDSHGLLFAIQALLYHRHILFFRVKEEGFSKEDYLKGVDVLKELKDSTQINAIALPGVGDSHIIDAMLPVCRLHHSILMTTESDLFDYLLH